MWGYFIFSAVCFYLAITLHKNNKKKAEKAAKSHLRKISEEESIEPIVDDISKSVTKYNPTTNYNKSNNRFFDDFIAFDLETTGLSATEDRILEIAAIKVLQDKIVDEFTCLINPRIPIPSHITKINGIDNSMVKTAPYIEDILPSFIEFIEDYPLIAHNASFDMKFICYNASRYGFVINNSSIDSLSLCRKAFPECKNHKLKTVASYIDYSGDEYHRALNDTKALVEVYLKCCSLLDPKEKAQEYDLDAHSNIITILKGANRNIDYITVNPTSSYLSLKFFQRYFINVKFQGKKTYIAVKIDKDKLLVPDKYVIEEKPNEIRIYLNNPSEIEDLQEIVLACYDSAYLIEQDYRKNYNKPLLSQEGNIS